MTWYTNWSDWEVGLVKRFYKKGKSAQQISTLCDNKSRAAVIGKAHRLGMSRSKIEIMLEAERKREGKEERPEPSMPVFRFLQKSFPVVLISFFLMGCQVTFTPGPTQEDLIILRDARLVAVDSFNQEIITCLENTVFPEECYE